MPHGSVGLLPIVVGGGPTLGVEFLHRDPGERVQLLHRVGKPGFQSLAGPGPMFKRTPVQHHLTVPGGSGPIAAANGTRCRPSAADGCGNVLNADVDAGQSAGQAPDTRASAWLTQAVKYSARCGRLRSGAGSPDSGLGSASGPRRPRPCRSLRCAMDPRLVVSPGGSPVSGGRPRTSLRSPQWKTARYRHHRRPCAARTQPPLTSDPVRDTTGGCAGHSGRVYQG